MASSFLNENLKTRGAPGGRRRRRPPWGPSSFRAMAPRRDAVTPWRQVFYHKFWRHASRLEALRFWRDASRLEAVVKRIYFYLCYYFKLSMMVDGSLPSHFALHCAYCDAFLSRRLSLLHALCLQVVPLTRSTRVLHRHSPFSRTAPSNNKS